MTTTSAPPTEPTSATVRSLLEPVREALLSDAATEAARAIAEAATAASGIVAAAEAQADTEVERVKRRAELSSQAFAEQALAQARRDGHRVVLTAKRDLELHLHDEVHHAFEALRSDTRYPALLDELEVLARQQLGQAAVITRDPHPGGGIIAEAGSRRVDYTMTVLADRALVALADKVAKLWT